ncbi:LOW QUALITY PROTEIN: B-cell lymphoma 6 protein homolog [Leucoraja erinacea]|uniref:LOW QUALITY PROTEIN: B-cell lymphoma 6 protein homolog n=1 Tax=Leucoraja erinaceus TaxID=7782 RepID=UPI00245752DA|nr:LOW QUALITY PROTEIN: B-cell lymphoma 6 protein homolog [Leucoraja erinacea]
MGSTAESYIKEFTRHSTDMMLNLNEMRKREMLTDVQLLAEGRQFRAHKAVLVACSGFFYSIFANQSRRPVDLVSLPVGVSAEGFRLLLDFMYTSCLPLEPATVAEVLTAAGHLQMEHVVEACRSYAHFRAPLGLSALKSRDPPPAAGPLPPAGSVSVLPWVPVGCGLRPDSAFRFPGGWRGPWLGLRRCPEPPLPPLPLPATGGESRCKPSPPLPDSPQRPGLRPSSPTESRSAGNGRAQAPGPAYQAQAPGSAYQAQAPGSAYQAQAPDQAQPQAPDQAQAQAQAPHKARNWKKYKLIVLNSLSQAAQARSQAPGAEEMEEEEEEEESSRSSTESQSYSDCSVCFERSSEFCHHVLDPRPGGETPEYHSELSDSGSETGALSCRSCRLKMADEDRLQQHFLLVHRDDKPYKCVMCRAAFRYKGNLASHKTIHTGEKPYRCDVCGAQFNRPANLKTHARIHSGEKPYKCETCGARFVQVAHLRAHVLIHTGEKPYPCETCGTRFRHLQTLKSHIRIHTGEKPYHCEKCDLHFRHKSQLRLHLRQKHGAITNTKVRYKVLPQPCPQPC